MQEGHHTLPLGLQYLPEEPAPIHAHEPALPSLNASEAVLYSKHTHSEEEYQALRRRVKYLERQLECQIERELERRLEAKRRVEELELQVQHAKAANHSEVMIASRLSQDISQVMSRYRYIAGTRASEQAAREEDAGGFEPC